MSNAALKRTIFVLMVVAVAGVTLLASLVTTHYDNAAYATSGELDSTPKMAPVLDRPYKAPVGVGITSKKATPENIAQLEEAAAEATIGEVATEAVAGVETEAAEAVETDWSEQANDVYAESTESYGEASDDFYTDIANAYGIDVYDGSGYYNANVDGAQYDGADFAFDGTYKDGSGMKYTWYQESALPGGGLDIPGRHVGDEGYVCDADGNVCLASSYLPQGTVVNIPFGSGTGVVYDAGCAYGTLDVYTSW